MKPAEWIDLIQRFPPADFDGFGIILENGLEITLQTVLQLNADHVLIRGRTVGSTDAGRYFYLPYDRISCIVFNRPKKEEEVLSWYDGAAPAAALPPAAEPEPVEEAAPAPALAAPIRPTPAVRPSVPAAARPAPAAARPAPTPPPGSVVRPAAMQPAAAQQATGLQTSSLANAQQSNPIKTALLERLRARRQGQDPPAPEKK